MSLGFGTSLGEFLIIEPLSNSILKCLSHIQLKMIPKNVKNHSYCAIGITSVCICAKFKMVPTFTYSYMLMIC